jgi:hypothetical protein
MARLARLWLKGFLVFVALAAGGLYGGLVVALPWLAVAKLIGWDTRAAVGWLLVSAFLWAPVAVGVAVRRLPAMYADAMRLSGKKGRSLPRG